MDVTIKNVPEGAEADVKNLAMVAITRFLEKPLQPETKILQNFKDNVDAVLVANDLPKRFDVPAYNETA